MINNHETNNINIISKHVCPISFDDKVNEANKNALYVSHANIRSLTNKTKRDSARIGIRPQHLYIDPKGTIEGTVTIIERLGTETIVELNAADGTLFRLASPEGPNLEVGQKVKFGFDTTKAHLF